MDKNKLNKIVERLEKYREWAKDMSIGELVSHKPAYKYLARDYCADVDDLIEALKEMTEAHELDLEMILELNTKISDLEADCAVALRHMRISDEEHKKLQIKLVKTLEDVQLLNEEVSRVGAQLDTVRKEKEYYRDVGADEAHKHGRQISDLCEQLKDKQRIFMETKHYLEDELNGIKTRIRPTEEEAYHTLHDWEDFWAMERKYPDTKNEPWSDIWKLLRTIKSTWNSNYELIKDNAELRRKLIHEQQISGNRLKESTEWEQSFHVADRRCADLHNKLVEIETIDIVFDGPPGPESGRFVEVEQNGKGINFGEWVQDGIFWKLKLRGSLTKNK